MNFLICNDDGISSQGIITLCKVIKELGKVYVFAPSEERSASSSAMTLHRDMILKKETSFPVNEVEAYSLYGGFPVDCAKVGFYMLSQQGIKIDCLISGINHGENTGVDLRYSGTLGAAFDGLEKNIPSFAVSLASYEKENIRFVKVAEFVKDFILDNIDKIKNTDRISYVYNINYPDTDKVVDIVYTYPADFFYKESFDLDCINENEKKILLKGERVFEPEKNENTDLWALSKNMVSITLLKPEFRYYEK